MKLQISIHNLFALSALLTLALTYQSCGQIDSKSSAVESVINSPSPIKSNVAVLPLSEVLQKDKIDLSDYFTSANIQNNQSNLVFFRQEAGDEINKIISVTKFNQSNNIEIFQADNDFIYIRYESTPESYGGIKDVVRRFEAINPAPYNFLNLLEVTGDPGRGAIWSKRFINAKDLQVPMITAMKIDVYNFTSIGQTPIFRNEFSTLGKEMYIWHDLQPIQTSIPFVSNENQPDHKLVVSQQWSPCNTEQYEYAQGVGYVGWRSLVSLHASCSDLYSGKENNTKTILKNYYRNSQNETYVVVQGMAVNAPIDISSFETVAKPSFEVGGLFLDDYPYTHTTPNNILSVLRKKPPLPVSDPNNLQSLVRTAFLEVLKRPPSEDEISIHLSSLVNGGTIDDLEASLMDSDEFAIGELYRLHLNRDPDPPGMEFYLGHVQSGNLSVDPGVKQNLRQSAECAFDCL